MLEGVHVLNTYDIVKTGWEELVFLAAVSVCITICLIVMIIYVWSFSKQKKDAVVPCVICGVFVLLSICVSICAFTHLPETKYQTRYVVTISDNVNFNEFNSRYEIVKQEGLIYTIVEKTDERGRE